MHRSLLISFALAVSACQLGAVETVTWRQASSADFEQGEIKNLSLRSDGLLSLAPVFNEILDSSSPYLWALAEDSKGNVYAGGGGPGSPGARVYVISPEGKSRVLAELDALEVHALAVDRSDRLYAATSPDGKVYRIGADGKPVLFYDPAAKYIWALAFDAGGNLFVATGDQGLIHRVTPEGKGAVFYRTDETHARSLAIDGKGNLIVGTEPGGLILRISQSGEGFVLHQAAKREITSVAVAKDGSVYAAGVGNKQPAVAPPVITAPPQAPAQSPGTITVPAAAAQQPAVPPPTLTTPTVTIAGGSEVYRVYPDGYARRVWSNAQDIVYSISFDAQARPLLGTGNRGKIYRLDSDVLYTALVDATPTQVTDLYTGRQGRVYAATGNIGKVYRIGPTLEKEGSIESDVYDADLFSLWGRLNYRGVANGGVVRAETRSGNMDRPRKDWSPWAVVTLDAEGGGRVTSPRARFLQWRLTLQASAAGASPDVQAVYVAYLPRNVAPVVEEIETTPANYRFPPQSLTLTPSKSITLQPLGRSRRPSPPIPASESPVTMQYEKGQIGARWAASDENDDALLYKVEIRGVQETEWKLLKDKVKEKHLSWDSTAFPDGEYVIRVTATDAPDNPPGQELTGQLVSESFLIDNTPPEITGPSATRSAGKLVVRWKAKDALSAIQKAEYSVDGGDWLVVEPTTKVSDSSEHEYELSLEGIPAGEHTIAVRVSDDYDNQAVAKAVVK